MTISRIAAPDKKKYYAYHLAAVSAARAQESRLVSAAAAAGGLPSISGLDGSAKLGGLDTEEESTLLYTVADLMAVSKSKTEVKANGEKALTIMHLCGNKWCLEASHYHVGTKAFNDNQVHCHFGLHSAATLEEYLQIQASYCKHEPKCWALPYEGALDLTAKFVETGLLDA
jgi:hypothetical protein